MWGWLKIIGTSSPTQRLPCDGLLKGRFYSKESTRYVKNLGLGDLINVTPAKWAPENVWLGFPGYPPGMGGFQQALVFVLCFCVASRTGWQWPFSAKIASGAFGGICGFWKTLLRETNGSLVFCLKFEMILYFLPWVNHQFSPPFSGDALRFPWLICAARRLSWWRMLGMVLMEVSLNAAVGLSSIPQGPSDPFSRSNPPWCQPAMYSDLSRMITPKVPKFCSDCFWESGPQNVVNTPFFMGILSECYVSFSDLRREVSTFLKAIWTSRKATDWRCANGQKAACFRCWEMS